MTTDTQKKTKLSDLRRLVYLLRRYARPYWKSIILLLLVSLVVTFLTALLPLIMAPILDTALGSPMGPAADGSQDITFGNLSLSNLGTAMLQWLSLTHITDKFRLVLILSGLYLVVGLLKALATFGSYLLALWIRVRSARDMQYDLFRHILSLSLGFFNKQRTGELMSRMDADTTATTYGFQGIIGPLIMSPILILFYGTLLVRTNPKLAFAVIIAAILHYGVTKGIQKPIRRHVTDQFSSFAELRARLQEAMLSIRVVKSFSAEAYELRKLGNAIKNVVRINMKYGVFKHVEEPVRGVVNCLVEVSILLLAAYELLSGHLAPSTFFLFLYVGRSMLTPISTLGGTFTVIQTTLAASERVFGLFAERPQVEDGAHGIESFEDRIKMENVSFAYDARRVLQQIDLEIQKGKIVALVGRSGVGKSTLADLLLRFYDPTEGRITIDGRDLLTLQQASYRKLFGVVSQEPLLFNATVRENISYGRDDLAEEDILDAAKIANAHEFIMELPQGYHTLVGDRGIRLSGGQRQRVAIARAVVDKPQILILDEATSSLDSESEKLVQEAIDRVIENTTAIIIAHRLSTVVHADKIVVLDRGRIVDQGRHGDLLQRCKLYRDSCQLQFGLGARTAGGD
ncbi:Vitamin B12 import ATP-binding protein BtuD [subsurface metagenome]